MIKSLSVLPLCVLLSAAVLSAAGPDPGQEKQIRSTMETLAQAVVAKDLATLNKVFHEELTYGHSDGRTQNKAEAVKGLMGPRIVESMTFENSTIRVYGSVALFKGINLLRGGNTKAEMSTSRLNILWVLVNGPQGWQVVARQTTRDTTGK
jgi:ketosteroid isomerase-like protein